MRRSKEEDSEICVITRWQMIKASLNNLSYAEFVDKAKQDANGITMDVRTEKEHEGLRIPGSCVIDYLDKNLADKIEGLDKEKTYYVYCRTGRRSLRVCVIMRNLGFEKVYNLEGGIVSMPTP